MVTPLYAELTFGDRTVRLNGGGEPSSDGLYVSSDGIEGWYSTPDAKVSMTEMQTGDGAHAVEEQAILYSARTVTLHWAAVGGSRDEALAGDLALLSSAHRLVRLRVVDASSDTYATGYTQVSADAGVATSAMTGAVTIVCADPRRYSTQAHRMQLGTSSETPGGLYYGSGEGLVYDIGYGGTPETLQNYGTLANNGTSASYPVITATGQIDAGMRLDWEGGSVAYSQPVGYVPVVFDSLTRTANVAGLDVSRNLTSRAFPEVPANGSISLSLQAAGTGWVNVEWHDTYI